MSIFPTKGQKALWIEGGEVPRKPLAPGGEDQNSVRSAGFLGRDPVSWPEVEGVGWPPTLPPEVSLDHNIQVTGRVRGLHTLGGIWRFSARLRG